jgi:hypothetical protein
MGIDPFVRCLHQFGQIIVGNPFGRDVGTDTSDDCSYRLFHLFASLIYWEIRAFDGRNSTSPHPAKPLFP